MKLETLNQEQAFKNSKIQHDFSRNSQKEKQESLKEGEKIQDRETIGDLWPKLMNQSIEIWERLKFQWRMCFVEHCEYTTRRTNHRGLHFLTKNPNRNRNFKTLIGSNLRRISSLSNGTENSFHFSEVERPTERGKYEC